MPIQIPEGFFQEEKTPGTSPRVGFCDRRQLRDFLDFNEFLRGPHGGEIGHFFWMVQFLSFIALNPSQSLVFLLRPF